jgi:multiple sugar transport system permease protein
MRIPSPREIATEAKLLLIGIPVLIWTLLPIYHMVLFAMSPKESAFLRQALARQSDPCTTFGVVFRQEHFYPAPFLGAVLEFAGDRGATGVITLLDRDRPRPSPSAGSR